MNEVFKVGDTVKSTTDPYNKWGNFIVVKAVECLKGWRYTLAFPKKDGTPNKRREKLCQWEYELVLVSPSAETI